MNDVASQIQGIYHVEKEESDIEDSVRTSILFAEIGVLVFLCQFQINKEQYHSFTQFVSVFLFTSPLCIQRLCLSCTEEGSDNGTRMGGGGR